MSGICQRVVLVPPRLVPLFSAASARLRRRQMLPPTQRSRFMASTTSLSQTAVSRLAQFSACDVSDALLKLKVPRAGFIPDLIHYGANQEATAPTIAPVSTVLFAAKGESPTVPAPNLPKDTHWADAAEPGTFVVMKQPPGQTNAICGGILALRMKVRQVKGIIVAGRVRDVQELQSTNLPILAHGQSTVGSGGSSIPWALQVPLDIHGVTVTPGDIAFQDPVNGVVIVPQDKVDQVLDILPKLTSADDRIKEAVLDGMSVHDAFKRYR